MSTARVNVMTQRPLFSHLRLLTSKYFEIFAADTIPLKVRIAAPFPVSGFNEGEWVSVKGQIQFIQVPNSNRYVPVIRADNGDINRTQPRSEYE